MLLVAFLIIFIIFLFYINMPLALFVAFLLWCWKLFPIFVTSLGLKFVISWIIFIVFLFYINMPWALFVAFCLWCWNVFLAILEWIFSWYQNQFLINIGHFLMKLWDFTSEPRNFLHKGATCFYLSRNLFILMFKHFAFIS